MKFSFAWILLICGFLFTRFYNLGSLPLFSDEGYAVARAWELKKTGDLLGMVKYTTQPIFIWLIALFQILPLNNIINAVPSPNTPETILPLIILFNGNI